MLREVNDHKTTPPLKNTAMIFIQPPEAEISPGWVATVGSTIFVCFRCI